MGSAIGLTLASFMLLLGAEAFSQSGEQEAPERSNAAMDLFNAKEYEQAIPLLEQACRKTERDACLALSDAHAEGLGVAIDQAKAFTYAKRACELDNSDGCLVAAYRLLNGKGTKISADEAVSQFQRGCSLGDPYSCFYGAKTIGERNPKDFGDEHEKDMYFRAGNSFLEMFYTASETGGTSLENVEETLEMARFAYSLADELGLEGQRMATCFHAKIKEAAADLDGAFKLLKTCVRMQRALEDSPRLRTHFLLLLSQVSLSVGEHDQAKSAIENALQMLSSLDDEDINHRDEAFRVLTTAAGIFGASTRPEDIRRAIQYVDRAKSHSLTTTNLPFLKQKKGDLHFRLGEFDRALELYQDGLKATEDADLRESLNLAIGRVMMSQGRHKEAIETLGRSSQSDIFTFTALADAHLSLGQHAQAVEALKKAIQINQKETRRSDFLVADASLRLRLGRAFLGQEHSAQGEAEIYQAAASVFEFLKQSLIFGLIKSDPTEAVTHVQSWSLQLDALSSFYAPREALTLAMMAQGLVHRTERYHQSIERKTKNDENLKKLFESYQRASAAVDVARTRWDTGPDAKVGKLVAERDAIAGRLKSVLARESNPMILDSEPGAAVCEVAREQKTAFVVGSPRAHLTETGRWSAPVYDLLYVVPDDESCRFSRHLSEAAILDGAINDFGSKREAVERCIETAKRTVGKCRRQLAAMDTAGATIRRIVWDPIEKNLGTVENVTFVSHGRLAEVPFAALVRDDGTYLVEKYLINYLPYAAAILESVDAEESATGRGALVVGDLDYRFTESTAAEARSHWKYCSKGECGGLTEEQVSALDAETGEAVLMGTSACGYDIDDWRSLSTSPQHVSELLSRKLNEQATLIEERSAHEQAVLLSMQGKRIIHLATHGFYSPPGRCESERSPTGSSPDPLDQEQRPKASNDPLLRSALVLSGANTAATRDASTDGVVTARDLARLDLRGTEIVSLAACETGRGDTTKGEGSFGLARALLVAGARSAIVSLWKVPNSTTVELFDSLYVRALDSGPKKATAPEALRHAQLEQIKRYHESGIPNSAFMWGAFVPMQNGF